MWCKVDVHWSSGVANRAFWLMAKGFNTTCNDGSKPAAIGEEAREGGRLKQQGP
jgi:Zn-dependent metalloprotease